MSVASLPERSSEPIHDRPIRFEAARDVLAVARAAGRTRLLEPEGLELLRALGIGTPASVFLPLGREPVPSDLEPLETDRIVVKVVAESLAHKTEAGGVAMVPRTVQAVAAAIRDMRTRLAAHPIAGFLVSELVEHDPGLGGELLVSVRWNEAFGPVVTVGAGGIHAELLAADLRPGRELAVLAPVPAPRRGLAETLSGVTAVRLATEPQRGRAALGSITHLEDLVRRLLSYADALVPGEVAEVEINPFAVTRGGLVALDVLVTLGDGRQPWPRPAAPTSKLHALLEPESIAIAGVSSGDNPGRTILRNVLRDGFEPGRVVVVKPGVTVIDGCRCVPDVASVPFRPDLLVIALSASRAVEMVEEVVRLDAAESIIVIPGGLEETAGGRGLGARMRAAVADARASGLTPPVINGGNCLGIRSRPGRYDTLFIPAAKLAPPGDHPAPLAIVAQSGAFGISRLSRLAGMDPKYVITVGNQLDLTVGDHLAHLADDPEIDVVGVYVEGFAPLDGRRFLEAAGAIAERGGVVVLYQAGRTPAGASASASHTASIAGDAVVTAALARAVGVVMAPTITRFDDLVRTFTLLSQRSIRGRRLGAVSNAGFECVAVGDNLGGLELAAFEPTTRARLGTILEAAGAGGVVDVHDPLDVTPMAGDAAFADAVEAVLDDASVDIALVGVVPFTAAMQTLPAGQGGEHMEAAGAIADRLAGLWRRSSKAWVAVVDAGPAYDPFAAALEDARIPTFRTADAALATLGTIVEARLGRSSR